jgi:hypothetical protein
MARLASLVCALVLVASWSSTVKADETDFSRFYRAAERCLGHLKRPLGFDLDKRVLCFDGLLTPDVDISLAKKLMPNGLFVIRSPGGDLVVAAALADILRERNATVVVYDYCFSACASYLLLASHEAFVLRNTVVAWHYAVDPSWCAVLVAAEDGGPGRLEKSPCPDAPPGAQNGDWVRRDMNLKFYAGRAVDPRFDDPPESFAIRRILTTMFQETGKYPDVMWTWNPRYYASALKTKITYEAYPQSQDEVDALMARISPVRVIYDP